MPPTAGEAALVETTGLTFGFAHEEPVLVDVDLVVGREVVALTGASGTGKTTLLLCLAGIHVPRSGSIRVAGRRLDGADLDERCRVRRESLGLVFQFSELVAELTLAQNVALPVEILGGSRRTALASARDLLTELGLDGLGDRYPSQVSGGQAQRAAVARALVHNPAVVLADEPTGALDPQNAARVLDLMLGAAQRRDAAVLLVTHDAGVAGHADRTVDAATLSRRDVSSAVVAR